MKENDLKERLRIALEPVVIDSRKSNLVDDLYAIMVDIAREVAQEEVEAFRQRIRSRAAKMQQESETGEST
ncbi:MAG: hypothetical protein CL610_16855 [Anaerolineaceae bacterium]|nr:hypothetical protein [Anaerolineaceae bacterium]